MDYKLFNSKGIFILDESFGQNIFLNNKTRKLKYLLKSCKSEGIISQGSVFSNNCLALAYYSKILKIKFKFLLIINKKKIEIEKFPNIKFSKKLGAEIIFIEKKKAEEKIDHFKNKFSKYLWIPGGGHTNESLKEYYKLAMQLFKERDDLSKIEWILLPFGTGTTTSGFLKAVHELKKKIKVIGVSVSRDKKKCKESVLEFLDEDYLDNLKIIDDYSGMYGKILEEDKGSQEKFFNDHQLLVDPIYNIRSVNYYYKNNLTNGMIVNTGGSANNFL